MLWDLIRDFFVQHVFGGTTSLGDAYSTFLGLGTITNHNDYLYEGTWLYGNEEPYFKIASDYMKDADVMISMGDWLSTTATIISITIIVVLCCVFIKQLVKLVGGLLR